MSEASEKKDYRDDMILDDIRANDIEMTKHAIKNAIKYPMGSDLQKAMINCRVFTKQCIKATYDYLGIKFNPPKNPKKQMAYAQRFDRLLKEKNIEMEIRQNYSGKDIWKKGIYFYKDGILVSFISNLLRDVEIIMDQNGLAPPKPNPGDFFIVTNAPLDRHKKFYTPGDSKIIQPKMIIQPGKKAPMLFK